MSRIAAVWFPVLGLAFAVAGADKLYGLRGYRMMFRHWGWSERQMRAVGASEVLGGALLLAPATRRAGGVLLAATSATVLTAELRHREGSLGGPRLALLAAAVTALLPRPARGR